MTASEASSKIGGPIITVPGPVPQIRRDWAKTMLNTSLANYAPQKQATEEKPTPYEGPNIYIEDSKQRKIKLDDLLAGTLAKVGYARVAKLTYRADWSTPAVEHVLNFDTEGAPKIFLYGTAGLRNAAAEAFARQCKRYTIPVVRDSKPMASPWWCPMHFSLGMLGAWNGERNINTLDFSPPELGDLIVGAISRHLKPYIGGVTTLRALFDFLCQDDEPMRWFRVGAYYRAALVANLGRQLGEPDERLQQVLRSHSANIMNCLDKTRTTADAYIANVIRDADISLAANVVQLN